MTSEQLQTVRAERWRHIANPLLTADDARAWLDAAGLALFLPRRAQFLAPAPSFVEACAGAPSETPSREAIDNAASLMHRLVAEGAILPLNLFGTPSETPDFLTSREAFPYLYSLRGTREWKTEPAGKSSPLVIEIWKHLEKDGLNTAGEIQSALGRELTEAAVIRGLMELWSNLRVLPEFEGGKTRWNLTQARYKSELNAAAKTSQTTALSALVSLYLESVLAVSSEEVETFLSPLTARSRVRETVNGLVATRQISLVPVGTQSMFHIAGALPEFAEPEEVETEAVAIDAAATEAATKPRQADRAPRIFDRGVKPFERKPFEKKTGERKTFGRKAVERGAPSRPARAAGAGGGSEGEVKPWPRKEGGERKSLGGKPAFGKKPSDKADRPFRREAKPFDAERPAGSGELAASGERAESRERSSFRPAARSGGLGRPSVGGKFPPKRFGSKPGGRPAGGKFESRGDRPVRPSRPDRAGEERRPSASADRPRTFRPRPVGAASADRPRTFRPRDEGGAEKRSGGFAGRSKFAGPKKFGAPKPGGFKAGGFKSAGAKFGAKGKPADGEKRPFFRKRPEADAAGESRPRTYSRPGFGAGRPAGRSGPPSGASRRGAGGFKDKPAGGSRFSKPGGSYSKPGGSHSKRAADGAERPRAARPASDDATSSRPASGRPAFKSDRPTFSKPPFAKPGKPGFSKGKSGVSSFGPKKFGGKPAGSGAKFGGAKKFGGPKNFAPRKPSSKAGGKPGGSRPPFRKRKEEGGTNAE